MDGLRLPRVRARRDHEVVGVVAHRPHVEDGDVGCQLLLAESGDAACGLERCQVGCVRSVRACADRHKPRLTEAYPRPRDRSTSAIQRQTGDLGRDRGGHEAVDRLAGGRARPDLRGGDGKRLDLEERDAIGALELRQHGVQPARARPRGASPRRAARARARARAPSTRGTRRTRRRRRGTPDRRARAPRASRPCARTGRGPTSASSSGANASSGEEQPDARRRCRPPCAPDPRRPGRAAGRAAKCSTPRRASSTWPTCGGSNAPPKTPTARPTRAPRRRSRRARPCGSRRRAAPPRAPRPRARPRRPGSRLRCGGCGSAAAPAASGGSRGTRAASPPPRPAPAPPGRGRRGRCFSSGMPAPVAHETRWTATMRSSSIENGAGSGLRSALLRTTICGRSSSPAP